MESLKLIGVAGMDVNKYIDMQKEKGNELDLGTMEGVYVSEVEDAGAASDAGIEKGDVITAIDGKKIKKITELWEYPPSK